MIVKHGTTYFLYYFFLLRMHIMIGRMNDLFSASLSKQLNEQEKWEKNCSKQMLNEHELSLDRVKKWSLIAHSYTKIFLFNSNIVRAKRVCIVVKEKKQRSQNRRTTWKRVVCMSCVIRLYVVIVLFIWWPSLLLFPTCFSQQFYIGHICTYSNIWKWFIDWAYKASLFVHHLMMVHVHVQWPLVFR